MDAGVYSIYLSPKEKDKVIKLVGRKCIVRYQLENLTTDCTYDTGAEVCLVPRKWLKENGLLSKVKPVEDLLDEGDAKLMLQSAIKTDIPYTGWVHLDLSMDGWNNGKLRVPFLVSDADLEHPSIGTNVMEEIIQRPEWHDIEQDQVLQSLKTAFKRIPGEKVERFVNLIQTSSKGEICDLKTIKRPIVIPKRSNILVECRANTGCVLEKTPVVFEPSVNQVWPEGLDIPQTMVTMEKGTSCRISVPVSNVTDRDIILHPRTLIGSIQSVSLVTPLDVKLSTRIDGEEKEEIVMDNGDPSRCEQRVSAMPLLNYGEAAYLKSRNIEEIQVADVNKLTQERIKQGVKGESSRIDHMVPTQPLLNGETFPSKPKKSQEIPQVDLSNLTQEQKELVEKMLIEEADSFVSDDDEIGCMKQESQGNMMLKLAQFI